MSLRRTLAVGTVAIVAATGLTACSGGSSDVIRIGTTDAAQTAWDVFKEKAQEEGLNIDVVEFTDFSTPNPALSQGQLDVNKFQHIKFLADYNASSDEDLRILGSTEIYVLALFWKDHDSLDGIDGQEVAIPNDPSNQGRAINVLAQAGLVTLREEGLDDPTPSDIDADASRVSVIPVDASQTPNAYNEGRPAVINNTWLERANIDAHTSLAEDDPNTEASEPYINVFATTSDRVNDEDLLKLVEIWHSDEVTEAVQFDSSGTAVAVERDQDELNDILERLESEAS